ncbi:MAG: recombinase family protein [Bdellovibrio sp.]|nr:recombinase family protein [Bdellovibrio sp.]
MRTVGLYIRVSTEEQAKIHEGSLVSQRHRLEEYVKARNLIDKNWGTIVATFVDEAKSGKNTNRPQYQEMLRGVERGKINTILVTELSRLSRSMKDFCNLWDFLKAHNAQFLSLREQFDTTSAAGEMMMFSIMNFAQFERKQTSERVSANFKARATSGPNPKSCL